VETDVFVQNVKKYCEWKGVKPTIACAESGAGKSLLSEISSRGRIPSIERVQLLAQYLGCTVSDLLGETPGALPPALDGPTGQFLKLFTTLDDKAQAEIVAEMLKRKK
jgi:transcriptional regulator with XRE-family HTH domain